MAKGYWIVNNIVNDGETYKAYQAANAAPFAASVRVSENVTSKPDRPTFRSSG